jgi:zinc protease
VLTNRAQFAALLILLFVTGHALAKPEWQQKTLKNGLQVIVIENHSVPLVTVELAVKNGSYTEPPEFNGLSHLYEHMFFQSNERSQTEGYLEKIGEAGAQFNAQTREEVVNYYYTALKRGLRPVMMFMRDELRYPLFDKGELEREIQVVLDEFARNEANPYFHFNRAIDQRLWYKHFSRKNIIGDRKVIETCTPEKMRAIQRKFYLPNNTALVVAGDVNAQEIFQMAEELYGDWPAGEDPFLKNPLAEHPPLTKDEPVIVTQPVNAASLMMSYHGPSTDTDAAATYAADVLSFALRQQDSKFYKALVDTGITTGATMGYYTQRNVGPIQFTAQTTADKLKAAIKALNTEIAKLEALDYITDEQLESAKTLLEANEIFTREKPSEYAHTVSFWWASSGLDYYANYVENCRKVTKADIQRYVQKYIKGKHRVIGVILSEAEKKQIGLTEQDLLVK